MVDVPHEPPPSIDPVEGLCALEHRLGLAGYAVAQEAPDGAVDGLPLQQRHRLPHGLFEEGLRDDGHVGLLGPGENRLQSWRLADEVALYFTLPPVAALLAVELEAVLRRHLVLEQSAGLDASQRPQRERQGDRGRRRSRHALLRSSVRDPRWDQWRSTGASLQRLEAPDRVEDNRKDHPHLALKLGHMPAVAFAVASCTDCVPGRNVRRGLAGR